MSGLSLLLACSLAAAQEDAAERSRIAREKAGIESAFAGRERECQDRFVVTACVEDAQRLRRNALVELRRQTAVLDEKLRKERAQRRLESIRDNLARDEAERRDQLLRPPREPEDLPLQNLRREPREANTARTPAVPRAPQPPAVRASAPAAPTDRGAQEARSRAAYAARQSEAKAHRDEVSRRNAPRLATRKPAAPLPDAAAASGVAP